MPPVLIGVPWDESSSFKRGAAHAPKVIREALRSPASNQWSESLVYLGRADHLGDAGDLIVEPEPAAARQQIEARIREILANGDRPISLGGDHSITYPIIRGFGPPHGRFSLLQIDAHGDLYNEFEGDRYSHACPFTRILEEGLLEKLVQVGIRTMNEEQHANAVRFGVETIDMRAWAAGVRPSVKGPVYLSVDMDGFDPAFAPGVSHREAGGMTVRDVLTLIQQLDGPIVGADIVEFNPAEDPGGITAPVCAKLIKEIAAKMLET